MQTERFQREGERQAHDAAMWQWAKNVVRRLLGLPITKTSAEARREFLDSYFRKEGS